MILDEATNKDEDDEHSDGGSSLIDCVCSVNWQGLIKEFELSVVLNKSRSGSFGFTITRSKLDNCYYIQEVLDNPAKTDGRIRAGDRLIMVRTMHMCKHTIYNNVQLQFRHLPDA